MVLTVRRRDGRIVQATVVVERDPRVEIVAVEGAASTLGEDARAFRAAWLASRATLNDGAPRIHRKRPCQATAPTPIFVVSI